MTRRGTVCRPGRTWPGSGTPISVEIRSTSGRHHRRPPEGVLRRQSPARDEMAQHNPDRKNDEHIIPE